MRDAHRAGADARSSRADLRLRATVGDREEFVFATADGVASPDAFRVSELGLLDVLTEDVPDSLLLPDANYGVVGTVLASFGSDVRMTETSARAAGLCRANAARNGVDAAVAVTGDPRALPARFDAVALAPVGYVPCAVVEQRLADALRTLAPDGAVYLAATPETGLGRYRRTLDELCESVAVVAEGDCTVLRGCPASPYEPPRYAEPRTISTTVDGRTLALVTYPGLFSASGLDDGTRALAEGLAFEDGERVLDLACGYGPLGLYAGLSAECAVTLTDDDCVATACARASAERTGVAVRNVVTADGVAGVRGQQFDRVVCNPPTHAGSGVLDDLLRGAADVLAADGRIDLVHHRGVEFDRFLEPHFGDVSAVEDGEYCLVTARP